MKQLLFILVVAISAYSIQIYAKEEVLASITNDDNDDNDDVYTFVADSDDTNQNLKTFYRDDYVNGAKVSREILPSDDLSKDGVVLDKRNDQTVMALKSSNFSMSEGGNVTIDTLFSGVTGERKQYEVQLTRDGENWKIYNQNIAISKMHIEVNKKVILGTVGIKNIQME